MAGLLALVRYVLKKFTAAAAWTIRAQAQTTAQNRKARRTSFDSASSARDAIHFNRPALLFTGHLR